MEWIKAILKEDGAIEIPDRWLFLHYYEALTILFRIENALRIFVYVVLKNELQDEWCNLSITSDDSQQGTIKAIAKKRIAQAKSFGYLGYPITCPIMHLTSGELIRLITADPYWKYFKEYFFGSKEIMKNKLDEIGTIRNSLAHFRPLKQGDVDLVKQNSEHVLLGVEKCISEMITCKNVVPTNTTDPWYKELRTLGTDNCTLSFSQSGDERWIRISITYNCPVLSKRKFLDTLLDYRVLNLISPSIPKKSSLLTKYITYLSEYIPYTTMDEEALIPNYRKTMILVFTKRLLSQHYAEIKDEMEKLLLQISQESDLIKQDNLAKGEIVESIITDARLKETPAGKYWSLPTDSFLYNIAEDDPPEFWGSFPTYIRDFVGATETYPWMPTKVSEQKLPF